jgi:NAD(P)-dependent dehydrogenase (short-subunit alcohol dehydrogenase family)
MDLNLKDKVAVITGGSRGIGLAVAELLVEEGARVVVGSRTLSPELAALDALPVAVDLGTAGGAEALVDAAVRRHGGIDVLVNNVAHTEPAGTIAEFSDEQWRRIVDLTLFAAVRTTRAALPAMRGRDGASIVNIGSLTARVPAGMIAPYSAAKAALANLGTALSEELAPAIRVNTVSPGPVRTPLWTAPGGFASVMGPPGMTGDQVMDEVLPSAMAITTGRVSEPREVAALVAYLASPLAANITGADFVIDGGMNKAA